MSLIGFVLTFALAGMIIPALLLLLEALIHRGRHREDRTAWDWARLLGGFGIAGAAVGVLIGVGGGSYNPFMGLY